MAKNSAAPTTSAGSPHRPRAVDDSSRARAPSVQWAEMSVRKEPAWIAGHADLHVDVLPD